MYIYRGRVVFFHSTPPAAFRMTKILQIYAYNIMTPKQPNRMTLDSTVVSPEHKLPAPGSVSKKPQSSGMILAGEVMAHRPKIQIGR